MRNRQVSRVLVTFAALAAGASILALTGCVSYTNVNGPESPPSFQSPNHFAAVDVTGEALEWVLTNHGPDDGDGYVVNLPAGITQENAMKIFARLPDGAVWPGSVDQDPAGMFHIARVWIRSSEAKVDVVFPMVNHKGILEHRGVTVWLHGGVRPWRAVRGQYWAPGTIEVPGVAVPWNEADMLIEDTQSNNSSDRVEIAEPKAAVEPADEERVEEAVEEGFDAPGSIREVPLNEG